MSNEVIILGAGAIGRGYLPWVLDLNAYELIFVDANPKLVDLLNHRKSFKTYKVVGGRLEVKEVPVKKAYHVSQFSASRHKPALVFMNVGPRNCISAAATLAGIDCPVILSENNPDTVKHVKTALNYERVYFAIPDVITSSSASPELLAEDPLSIISEDGVFFVDKGAGDIKGDVHYCDEEELKKQWTGKFFLHNTPHCIAAYLGGLIGSKYLHEAMRDEEIKTIVSGAMSEMLVALKLKWEIPHSFLDFYADKEIKRFCSELLHDPISRVAREPLRKLELDGRLINSAQICLASGFIPKNILTGIVAALLFCDEKDGDHQLSFMYHNLSSKLLLTYVLGLREGEVLEMVLRERLTVIIDELEALKARYTKTSKESYGKQVVAGV